MIHEVDFDCTMHLWYNRLHSDAQDQVDYFERSVKYVGLNSQLEDLPDRKLDLLILLLVFYCDFEVIFGSQGLCVVSAKQEDDFTL